MQISQNKSQPLHFLAVDHPIYVSLVRAFSIFVSSANCVCSFPFRIRLSCAAFVVAMHFSRYPYLLLCFVLLAAADWTTDVWDVVVVGAGPSGINQFELPFLFAILGH